MLQRSGHVNEMIQFQTKSIVNTHVLNSVQLLGSFKSATEDVVMMQSIVFSISLSFVVFRENFALAMENAME